MARNKSLLLPLCLLIAAAFVLQCCGPNPDDGDLGSISGRVFFDDNANEECDDCECGIAEANITLYESACGGTMVQMIKTDAEGYFEFFNVSPGSYCVYSAMPPMCDYYLPTTSLSREVDLAQGEVVELEWFGYDLYIDSLRDEEKIPTAQP